MGKLFFKKKEKLAILPVSSTAMAYNGSGIKEAAPNTKRNSMNNDKSKYEAQMFEPAQRFLLMPCYVSALASVRWVVLKNKNSFF